MSEDNHEYEKKIEELDNYPGYKYKMSRIEHSRSLYIYTENFHELASFIDSVETPESHFEQGWNELENEKILFLKLQRYFHNYVASAESLVSHTRKYVRNSYSGHAFFSQYENRKTEFFCRASANGSYRRYEKLRSSPGTSCINDNHSN